MLKFERSQYDSKKKERKKTGVKIEIGGWDSFSSLPSWRALSFEKKMLWMLMEAVSLETVNLSIQYKC